MKPIKLISFVSIIGIFTCCTGLPKNKPVHVISNYKDTIVVKDTIHTDTNDIAYSDYKDTISPDRIYIDTAEGVICKDHYVKEDSFCIEADGNKVKIKFFHEEYYLNGVLKEKDIQGYGYEGGAFVGTTYQYDSSGKLVAMVQHHTAKFEDAFLLITNYYSNGVPKSTRKYKNFDEYEIDSVPIGLWHFYDTAGTLIKTEQYDKDGELIKTEHYVPDRSNSR